MARKTTAPVSPIAPLLPIAPIALIAPNSRSREPAEPTLSEIDGVRYLHLGTPWVQGAMRIKQPNAIELEYVQRMMAWMLLRPEDELVSGHAVQFGLGAAAITRFCHDVMKMRTTAVELSPEVIMICRLYFKLGPDSARLSAVQSDAAAYAADSRHAGTADVLCVDLYDDDAAGPVHDSEAFYRDCHRLLAPTGVMSVNLFGRHASFSVSAARIAAVFGDGNVASLQPTKEGNTIVIAIKGGVESSAIPERSVLVARAENIETRFGLPAKKWVKMIRRWEAANRSPELPIAATDTSNS